MWKNIPNWEWYLINEQGKVLNTRTNRYLKGDINNIGYHRVILYDNKRKQRFFIHRLVATLFLPNPNNLPEVNHIDGNKDNNSVNNLEWCTTSENQKWAVKIGNSRAAHQWGEDNAQCVLSSDDVKRIFELRQEGYTHQAIADIYHVSRRHIGNILQGKRRKQG